MTITVREVTENYIDDGDGGVTAYDHNYDAINVDKVADIPVDYDGVMGAPITFLDKYSPEQFDIIGLFTEADGDEFIQGLSVDTDDKHHNSRCPVLNNKRLYSRILIRK